MIPLKLKELQEGVVYWDIISQRPVLITSIEEVEYVDLKNGTYKALDARGTIFSEGKYDYNVHINDNQLREIKTSEL